MNDLVTMTDTELDNAINAIKERELAMQTEAGKNYVVGKMRECIGLLETWGYKFDGNEVGLAKLWADGLSEEFVRLGADGIRKAVIKWAETDDSEYRSFPKIAWIVEACKSIGGDPRAEKGRRVQAEAERQMEIDHRKEFDELQKAHPEWLEKRAEIWERLNLK